jgi:uncharacterized protein (TIGR04255 family)
MIFPDSDRVLYDDNTLEEVVCQVRFPAILKISEPPIEFQERVRLDFPLLEQKPPIDFPENMPPEMAKMLSAGAGTVFQFLSRDRVWAISLYREFLALTCSKYQRWEKFKSHFEGLFRALSDIYSPAFFSRIGLRYRNVIHRNKLQLADVPWSQLLRPEICGELSAPTIEGRAEQAARELILNLGEGRKVRLAHWLVPADDSYVIDADFYIESEVEVANVSAQLDAFNRESGRLFRWAITEKLHTALGPRKI